MGVDADSEPRRAHGANGHRAGGLDRAALRDTEIPPSLGRVRREGARAARPRVSEQELETGGGPEREKVMLELSPAQVDRVIRSAADGGSMSLLLSGLHDIREVLAREPSQLDDNRLSRSLLAGLLMLASFPTDGSYLGNAEIARLLDMNPSTTHRYVSTLVAVGLLERDPGTRRYRLV